MSTSRIVVAMSGGVDSSVAAMMLAQQGHDVVGVSMQVWDYRNNGGCKTRATCCAPDDFTDARVTAAKLNIPYYVFDFEKSFREQVIDRFVSFYAEGLTPNPCIDCNSKVKFKELRDRALRFGAGAVATGHYAQIEKRDDGFHLLRGADDGKDQSYFLYNLTQVELANTIFPVGHLTKPEVRAIARAAGIPTADKPESQDICFVSGKASDFVTRIGGLSKVQGKIVRSNGEQVGVHEGIHEFTVGQRKGIRRGGLEEPLYVLELIPEENVVVVGIKEELEREGFSLSDFNWVAPSVSKSFRAFAQVRSRHRGTAVDVTIHEDGSVRCVFLEKGAVVAPGQAAVLYDSCNREVLGGGRIMRPQRRSSFEREAA